MNPKILAAVVAAAFAGGLALGLLRHRDEDEQPAVYVPAPSPPADVWLT